MDIFDPGFQRKGLAVFLVGLAAVFGFLIGVFNVKDGGISAPKIDMTEIYRKTNAPTASLTYTPVPTETSLPTYTPPPTRTARPTNTSSPTRTPTITQTPTETPTPTRRYTRTPTSTVISNIVYPSSTPIQPTTAPPVVIESCKVDPITVPVDTSVSITFIVQFSTQVPGYGFEAINNPGYPGQGGCSATDTDGDGMAYCLGSSGAVPASTTVYVTIKSSVGDCVVSYSSR